MNKLRDHGSCISFFVQFTQSFQGQRDADRTGIYCWFPLFDVMNGRL